MGAVLFLLVGMIAVAIIGVLVYVIARQLNQNSTEDFERRDN